jgi:hypothetical protein
MAIFRVEKSKDYTVMSNYHLRDSSLSLKAKGLLSQMLSLPEGWDFTLTGLSEINKESKDAIRSAVNELEKAGYIVRHQTADAAGKFSSNEYIIYEQPVTDSPSLDFPTTENPTTENPMTENPTSENPTSEKPSTENPTQLNKDIFSKDIYKEKINKKEKSPPGKKSFDPMPLFVDWIGENFSDFSRDEKNSLYLALVRFVESRKDIKKPIQSRSAVTALCNKLMRFTADADGCIDVETMIDMLDTAASSGWRSVYRPGSAAAKQQKPKSGRVYEEL